MKILSHYYGLPPADPNDETEYSYRIADLEFLTEREINITAAAIGRALSGK